MATTCVQIAGVQPPAEMCGDVVWEADPALATTDDSFQPPR